MSRSIKITILLSLTALLSGMVLSCRPGPIAPATDEPDPHTGVSVTIPLVSPFLERALGIGPRPAGAVRPKASSRAYLGLNRVEMRLYDASDALVSEIEIERDYSNYSAMNATGDFIASPGTGYRVGVDIFNSFVSETQAVCSGTSAPFEITAGDIADVRITCAPNHPVALTVGTESPEISLAKGQYDFDTYTVTTGAEAWFSFVASAASMDIITTPTVPNELGYVVGSSNADGSEIANGGGETGISPGFDILTGNPPEYSVTIATVVDQTYLLGVACYDMKMNGSVYVPAGSFTLRVEATP